MKLKKGDQKKLAKSTLNKEEEQACANIFEIQKSFEASSDILLRIFTHLKENKSDS
jgi:Na+/phosphate symporter